MEVGRAKEAWAEVVAEWRQVLRLGSQQGSNSLDLIGVDEEQLLRDVLSTAGAPDQLHEDPPSAVDEALAEAAA